MIIIIIIISSSIIIIITPDKLNGLNANIDLEMVPSSWLRKLPSITLSAGARFWYKGEKDDVPKILLPAFINYAEFKCNEMLYITLTL